MIDLVRLLETRRDETQRIAGMLGAKDLVALTALSQTARAALFGMPEVWASPLKHVNLALYSAGQDDGSVKRRYANYLRFLLLVGLETRWLRDHISAQLAQSSLYEHRRASGLQLFKDDRLFEEAVAELRSVIKARLEPAQTTALIIKSFAWPASVPELGAQAKIYEVQREFTRFLQAPDTPEACVVAVAGHLLQNRLRPVNLADGSPHLDRLAGGRLLHAICGLAKTADDWDHVTRDVVSAHVNDETLALVVQKLSSGQLLAFLGRDYSTSDELSAEGERTLLRLLHVADIPSDQHEEVYRCFGNHAMNLSPEMQTRRRAMIDLRYVMRVFPRGSGTGTQAQVLSSLRTCRVSVRVQEGAELFPQRAAAALVDD
jgi:hypothetical protein